MAQFINNLAQTLVDAVVAKPKESLIATMAITGIAAVATGYHVKNFLRNKTKADHTATSKSEPFDQAKEASIAAVWEARRQQAMTDISVALLKDTGAPWMNGMTSKEQKAIELRLEVNTNCRNRDDRRMRQTEQRIVELITSSSI